MIHSYMNVIRDIHSQTHPFSFGLPRIPTEANGESFALMKCTATLLCRYLHSPHHLSDLRGMILSPSPSACLPHLQVSRTSLPRQTVPASETFLAVT